MLREGVGILGTKDAKCKMSLQSSLCAAGSSCWEEQPVNSTKFFTFGVERQSAD